MKTPDILKTNTEATTLRAFITDYGLVRAGTKTCIYMDGFERDLKARKSTKKYKRARYMMDRLQLAVETWAEIHWQDGGDMKATP